MDIDPSDMCAHCRMAVSLRQFAAEVIDPEEHVSKFDDVGCLLRYLGEHPLPRGEGATYVVDYDTKAWLKAGEAFYIVSPSVHTPMAGGIVAFGERARAEAFGKEHGTVTVLRFEELKAQ